MWTNLLDRLIIYKHPWHKSMRRIELGSFSSKFLFKLHVIMKFIKLQKSLPIEKIAYSIQENKTHLEYLNKCKKARSLTTFPYPLV